MLLDLNYIRNVKYIRFIYKIVRKRKKIRRIKNMFKNEKEKRNDTRIKYWECLLVASEMAYANSHKEFLFVIVQMDQQILSIIC